MSLRYLFNGTLEKVAELPVTSTSYSLPVSTNATYSSLYIYSQSVLGLSKAVVLQLTDLDFSPRAPQFVDQRLDQGELGGVIQWTEPTSDKVVQYNVLELKEGLTEVNSYKGHYEECYRYLMISLLRYEGKASQHELL